MEINNDLKDFENKYNKLKEIKDKLDGDSLSLFETIQNYQDAKSLYSELEQMLNYAQGVIVKIDSSNISESKSLESNDIDDEMPF